MKKNILILLLLLFVGCSVSSPTAKTSTKKKTKENVVVNTKENKSNNEIKEQQTKTKKSIDTANIAKKDKRTVRFKDTAVIEMEPIYAKKQKSENTKDNYISKEIDKANKLMDLGKFDEAMKIYLMLTSTLQVGDDFYYEAKFGEIECLIGTKKIEQAKELLLNLINDPQLNSETEEKTLVRLGQIECLNKDKSKSEFYFDRLRKKYPESIYLKVANCDFLKK